MDRQPDKTVPTLAKNLLYYFLTGLILVIPAVMNNSPLVYSDSGSYMARSFSLEPMTDRPMGYPLIIRAVTWQSTMWTVVFFQGMLASWLIFEVLRQVMPTRRSLWRVHVPLLFVLLLTSSLPWYASQLMPDALTGLIGLLLFLVFFGSGLGKVKLSFMWLCLFFIGLSHFAHLAVLIAVALCMIVVKLLPAFRASFGRWFWLNWSLLLAVVLGSMIFTRSYNKAYGHGWVMAPASDLFLAAKLCESGVMYEHLKRNCPQREHPLCSGLDKFDRSAMFYIWDEASPLRHPDGDVAASKAIAPLLNEVLGDPANWGMILSSTLTATLVQLTQVQIGSGLHAYRENSAPWWPYQKELHHELPLYMGSHQQLGKWNFSMVNNINYVALAVSLLSVILLWRTASRRVQCFVVVALVVVFFNAMATAGLANIYDRLQARVTWLLVLAACLMQLEWYLRKARERVV